MILLNFSHPITDVQRQQIETLTGTPITDELAVVPQFDEQQPFGPQLSALLDRVTLSSTEWQSEPILVVLPSLNFIAALLLAELHGRMGYFPSVIRTRPVVGSQPRRYEVSEILDLQDRRERARRCRN